VYYNGAEDAPSSHRRSRFEDGIYLKLLEAVKNLID
jgi:hypothetical protein